MKKVVIMLATYNGSRYLKNQLESIDKQIVEDVDIEVLVRDDGSDDNTVSILQWEYTNIKISLLEDNEKLGACNSFLKLLKNAPDADYYAFVDQDDLWDAEKLSIALKRLAEFPENEPVLWASNCRLINEKSEVINEQYKKQTPIFTVEAQLVCGSVQGCAMVFNKTLLEIVKKSKLKYIPMHDILVTILAICYGKVVYESKPLFSYRVHSNNVVAKSGKSIWKRINQSLNNWFGAEHKFEISKFANEILTNCSSLGDEEEEYLRELLECRDSLKARIRIVFDEKTVSDNRRALRSFRIRTLLGII